MEKVVSYQNLKEYLFSPTLIAGLAIFSMFFGAGNIFVPLEVGKISGDSIVAAFLGMFVSTILLPLLGLLSILLFNGNVKSYFYRAGVKPGFAFIAIFMLLIGPFGGIPRTVTLSYSSMKVFLPEISLYIYAFIAVLLIAFFTANKSQIIDVLGKYLTPVLLFFMAIMLIIGLGQDTKVITTGASATFYDGFIRGYQTMDLMAAIFFGSFVLQYLVVKEEDAHVEDHIAHLNMSSIGSFFICMALLALCYLGFIYLASTNVEQIGHYNREYLLAALATNILGPKFGLLASVVMALACLTTAIALTSIFADFLYVELLQKKGSYLASVFVTCIITFILALADFSGIMVLLEPIVVILYPVLIVLAVLNICYCLFDFQPVKIPLLIILALSTLSYFI